jgi:hypothetical protein
MKQFLLSLLVLAMFMPGMACAKFMDHAKPHMQMAQHMPCCPKAKNSSATMLFKDCMKAELSLADNVPLLKKLDIAKPAFPFILAHASGYNDFASTRITHASPFDRTAMLKPAPLPLFLTTQRLRI